MQQSNTKLLNHWRRTKIIATVGPSCHSYDAIKDIIEAGANGIRLNFSHGTNPERVQQVAWIRKASKELNKPVALIQDLQGPKIRLGDFEGEIQLYTGQTIILGLEAKYLHEGACSSV